MVKIIYIWHDCFAVSTPQANFVFDYWLDSDGAARDYPAFLDEFDSSRPLFVLVSHFHKDHYNPAIFGWASRFDDIHYIVSRDVFKRMRHIVSPTSVYHGPKVSPEQVSVLHNNESFTKGGTVVTAFPSTDVGNSYMVESGGIRIFHAGDLNCWLWIDESTPGEIRRAREDYKVCLDTIAARLGESPIDYCFFPVDSRIGSGYTEGPSEFVRRFNVRHFFPMHFELGDERERAVRRQDAVNTTLYANPARGEYIPLATPGSVYFDWGGECH